MSLDSEPMFELAARMKLRFPYKGNATVEDLWDLPVTELDGIFKTLSKKVKESQEESLLNKKTKADEELDLQINIIKHIFEVKTQEAEESKNLKLKIAEKRKLQGLIAEKEDEALKSMPLEELRKKYDAL